MAEGARAAKVPALQLSFVESLEVIKLALPDLQTATRKQLWGLREQLIAEIGRCRIDRPRRQHSYPRKVKRKVSVRSGRMFASLFDRGGPASGSAGAQPRDAEAGLGKSRPRLAR